MSRSASVLLLGLVLGSPAVMAGPCGQGDTQANAPERSWNLLARLEPDVRSGLAAGGIPDSGRATGDVATASAEVETYLRFHAEIAGGGARARLMPWPELRSWIQ